VLVAAIGHYSTEVWRFQRASAEYIRSCTGLVPGPIEYGPISLKPHLLAFAYTGVGKRRAKVDKNLGWLVDWAGKNDSY
jgi:hypothetical protein